MQPNRNAILSQETIADGVATGRALRSRAFHAALQRVFKTVRCGLAAAAVRGPRRVEDLRTIPGGLASAAR